MSTDNKTFSYRHSAPDSDKTRSAGPVSSGIWQRWRSWDFLTPYVVLTFLTAPSLGLMAAFKETSGFEALKSTGLFGLMMGILWLFLPAATLCAILHMLRSRHLLSKVFVAVFTVMLLSLFVYVLLPATVGGSSYE